MNDTHYTPQKITIFGTGYVGLVTGVCLAELGNDVLCVDTNPEKIYALQHGQSPIYERGMDELLAKNIAASRLHFTLDALEGVKHGDFLFIAVGTPSATYGSANLQFVYEVARNIGKYLDHEVIVVNKSTVPVGTGDKIKNIITREIDLRKNCHINFTVVSNPEFLKQGDAIADFMHADRVIIGSDDSEALAKMKNLYAPTGSRLVTMDIRSAELSKYAANAFLATKISFINEMAMLAEKFGADIKNIRLGIGTDPRIGMDFLNAGCGYGGSCFPKDVKALIWMARESGSEVPLFDAVENINTRQKCTIFNRLMKRFKNNLSNKRIALWGLAFKPNTDDMRDAPSRVLMELLWQEGAIVQAYDPVATKEAQRIYGSRPDLILTPNMTDALDNADVLVVITEWQEFMHPDFNLIKKKLLHPVIFDGRNLYDPQQVAKIGLEYYGIGRKAQHDDN